MARFARGLALVALLSLGCERGESAARAEVAPEVVKPAEPKAAEPRPVALTGRITRPAVPLVFALGDLHGDLAATRRALQLVGAIDAKDEWVGGTMTVVHTGDSVDRGDDDKGVVELLDALRAKAKAAGGELIALLGNHELMNVAGDFRYVTPASFEAFVGEGGRNTAFAPGGPYARRFAERPLFVRIGDSVFVHGGILPKHVTYGLSRMDDQVRAWLLGDVPQPPDIVATDDGPLWTRLYSLEPSAAACAELASVLKRLEARRMVVGHTVQERGITSGCDGQIWRIDVGMSRAYGGTVQALELRDGQVSVRK